jgi:hypothetical protein
MCLRFNLFFAHPIFFFLFDLIANSSPEEDVVKLGKSLPIKCSLKRNLTIKV